MIRFFDILFSSVALLILSPILAIIAVVLRFSGEGEVLYVQQRIGRHGKPFGLLKFATMLKNSPNIGHGDITVKDDPRVLPVGGFLRRTKLNELPQLINILVGDMSVVGPRPMLPKTFERYGRAGADLSQVRPGLTGLGSIVFRDEERFLAGRADPTAFYFDVIVPFKVKVELWYLENRSLTVYFAIIVLTAWVILFSDSKLYRRWLKGIPGMPLELNA